MEDNAEERFHGRVLLILSAHCMNTEWEKAEIDRGSEAVISG
jgi:hypothetical protein